MIAASAVGVVLLNVGTFGGVPTLALVGAVLFLACAAAAVRP